MKMFDADRVHANLPYPSLVSGLIEHHMNDIDDRGSAILQQPSSGGGSVDNFLALPAWQNGRAIGAKLVTVFPENEVSGVGLPNIQAVYVLFSGADGRPIAVIDGTALTLRKTAADSAMGASFLARDDSQHLVMVGAGALAPHLIQAHLAVRPSINRVSVWNRTHARADALVASFSLPGVSVAAVEDLEAAVRAADVVSCATMATEPLVKGEWLRPGTHLDLVGSFRPDMHECDSDAVARASVFVDSRWSAIEDCGEIVSALADGTLTSDGILADNFDFARGHHAGRATDKEITVFKNGGGGHLDLMVAQILTSPG